MTLRTKDAAAYLGEIADWKLSNLHIQKLLYMADMNFVGQTGERLVDEPFEAWDYGPVLPSLYHELKIFGSKPVTDIFWGAKEVSGTAESEMIARAYSALKGKTAGQLVENTHWSGGAWAKNYVPGAKGIRISDEDMMDEYRSRIAGIRARDAA